MTTDPTSTGPDVRGPLDLPMAGGSPGHEHADASTGGVERDGRDVPPVPTGADGPAGDGRDEDATRVFVEQMALVLSESGFPRMPARVLMALMCAEDPGLTAAGLAERVGISAAAVSGAVRLLTHVGLVTREPVPGSRRDVYRVQDDAWYAASLVKEDLMTRLAAMADAGVATLGGPTTTAGARVAQMRDFYAFVDVEMRAMLQRWNALQAGERRPDSPA